MTVVVIKAFLAVCKTALVSRRSCFIMKSIQPLILARNGATFSDPTLCAEERHELDYKFKFSN
jgi:hypothetical protein